MSMFQEPLLFVTSDSVQGLQQAPRLLPPADLAAKVRTSPACVEGAQQASTYGYRH